MAVGNQKASNQTLYIRNLNRRLPIKEVKRRLCQLVSRYAGVSKIKMTNKPGMLGQAFVHLSEASCGEIVDRINEMFFLGKVISVSFARSDMCIGRRKDVKGISNSKTLIVTEIPESLTKEDMEKLFGTFDGFQAVRFIRAKNLALIDFLSVENASAVYSQFEAGHIQYNDNLNEDIPVGIVLHVL